MRLVHAKRSFFLTDGHLGNPGFYNLQFRVRETIHFIGTSRLVHAKPLLLKEDLAGLSRVGGTSGPD